MQLDQFLDERQADARTFISAPARFYNAVETLEQLRQIFRRHADAGVAHVIQPIRPPASDSI